MTGRRRAMANSAPTKNALAATSATATMTPISIGSRTIAPPLRRTGACPGARRHDPAHAAPRRIPDSCLPAARRRSGGRLRRDGVRADADVTIATSFTPGEKPRNLVFHLPPGLAGDPFATPRCAEADYRADSCPAATKVGTVEADATVGPVPIALPATGVLYNLMPARAEPARLGAVIATPLGEKLFIPTTINVRASDGGLDSVVTDLPTTLGGLDLYTERMSFTLLGRPAGPFMRNPTSCKPATTTVEATSYDDPAVKTKTSCFTPTDCGALAFEPHIAASVGQRGLTARQSKPPVSTVITQGAEQAGQSSATVTLPPVVAPDLTQLGRACPADKAAVRACPASAKVGTVMAGTPLLAAPLTGDVFLVARGLGALP